MVGVRQFDEAAVMQSALDLFRRKGLAATSMLDLAEATGVRRGSLYNAYGGKDAIFLIAFEAYAECYLGMIREALDKTDPHAALTAFFEAVIASMSSGSPARGCLSTRAATEADAAGPAVQARLRQWLDEIETTIHAALAAPGLAGRLALPPKAAAQLLATFTRGLAVMERVYHDADRLRETAMALVRLMIQSEETGGPQGPADPHRRGVTGYGASRTRSSASRPRTKFKQIQTKTLLPPGARCRPRTPPAARRGRP